MTWTARREQDPTSSQGWIDVFVQKRHVEIWKADPDGQHRIIEISTTLGKIYGLGVFEPSQED
jgi:hypothetical protein